MDALRTLFLVIAVLLTATTTGASLWGAPGNVMRRLSVATVLAWAIFVVIV